ncbi:MAG TPA: response regulator transcription factor [Chthoniobacteraceae bacterium]
MTAIRVALIEDNAPFAKALEDFLHLSRSGVRFVATYPSGEEAMQTLPKDPPDVVLVDVNLPRMNGIECVARLKALCPNVLPLILTMYEDTPLIFDALKAGACGYLLKRTPPAEIVAAIQQVMTGGAPMSPQIARHVVSFFHRPTATDNITALTERERAVLDLLARGCLYKQIADQLGISIDTVRTHLRKIYDKLHVHSRTEAVLKYLERPGG